MAIIDYDRSKIAAAHVSGANMFGAMAIAGLFTLAYRVGNLQVMQIAVASVAAAYLSQFLGANAEVLMKPWLRVSMFVCLGAAIALWALGMLKLFA